MQVAVPERGARVGEQLLEAQRVDAAVLQRVAVGEAGDRRLAERCAQARDVMVERVARRGRKLLAPQPVDEAVDIDHPAAAERQHGEERLALRAADVRRRPTRDHLEWAEQPDFQRFLHRSSPPTSSVSRRKAR